MTSIALKIKKYWEIFLDYVFPKECFGCKKEGEYLCSPCFDKIKYIDDFYCFICNKKENKLGICPECALETGIDRIIIATHYTNNVAGRLIESFKYNFVQDLGNTLFKILDKQIISRDLSGIIQGKTLVPIPLHRKRFAERGFNQSEELAKRLSAKYGCSMKPNLLQRVKHTSQQAKLSRTERFSNIEGAFQMNLKEPVPVKVIIIDDVLTSGATFIAAARVLKAAGVKEVLCVAIAHG